MRERHSLISTHDRCDAMPLTKSGAKFSTATHSESTAALSEQEDQHKYSGVLDSFFKGIDRPWGGCLHRKETDHEDVHFTWCIAMVNCLRVCVRVRTPDIKHTAAGGIFDLPTQIILTIQYYFYCVAYSGQFHCIIKLGLIPNGYPESFSLPAGLLM